MLHRFIPLLALPLLAWLLPGEQEPGTDAPPSQAEKVNLALRRTADALLRLSGDSTSLIPGVQQLSPSTWQVRLDQSFSYDSLPRLLQSSFEEYGIGQPYQVAVRRCEDGTIALGYQQLDVLSPGPIPCQGRDMPEGCHFIEVQLEQPVVPILWWQRRAVWWTVLLLTSLAAFVWAYRRKKPASAPASVDPADTRWIVFGNSRLDVSGQVLVCGGERQSLTFREAKLLRLFAEHPGQLLQREQILQQVWADEGVLVGRSVDMFVSRLRKKLAPDPTLSLAAVHGVGYRLEVRQ